MEKLKTYFYIMIVSLLTFIMPLLSVMLEMYFVENVQPTFAMLSKWFIFWAVGMRLFIAGMKQTIDPAFTAREIFKFKTEESFPVIRELGFANSCFGLTAMFSFFFPDWRVVSAFASGIYYGIAGFQHLLKRPAGMNESFALFTDLFIFIVLLIYFVTQI